ncbi:MAG: hypothetical protein GY800_05420 [Planctomycetes bacterium]|nr:hypothetical protein [Planctomycetota bacterium]
MDVPETTNEMNMDSGVPTSVKSERRRVLLQIQTLLEGNCRDQVAYRNAKAKLEKLEIAMGVQPPAAARATTDGRPSRNDSICYAAPDEPVSTPPHNDGQPPYLNGTNEERSNEVSAELTKARKVVRRLEAEHRRERRMTRVAEDEEMERACHSMMPSGLDALRLDKAQDKMIGKLRRFDGTTPWMDYEIQFELCAQMNDWGEKTKLRNLACMLDGEAAQVLSTISKRYSEMEYVDLKQALIRRYSPQHQQEVYRLELKARRRKKDETIPALANDIRRLARQGWPEEG